MKTPREILFERHQAAQPKLDRIRRRALSLGLSREPGAGLVCLWQRLIWPCRRAWAGLAAIWVLLLALNAGMRDSSRASLPARLAPERAAAQTLFQQRRLLAELLEAAAPPPTERPRPVARPRSQRTLNWRAC